MNANIREFLDYEEITILVAQLSETNCITYHNEIPNNEDTSIVFYKIPKICFDETDDSNSLLQIGFLTLNGGVIRTIYNTMERIFSTRAAMVLGKSEFVSSFSLIIIINSFQYRNNITPSS